MEPFALRHHGLLRRSDAAALGVGRSSWYRAIDSGLLELLHVNVARLRGAPTSLQQRALAAVWAVGGRATASHRTATALWGVPRPDDDPVEVILADRTRCLTVPGVVVHRPRDLVDVRATERDGVPTTIPVRTLLDLAAVDPDGLAAATDEMLRRDLVNVKVLRAGLVRHAERGRNGITAFREVLDRLEGDMPPTDSQLETRMIELMRRHGLPRATFHARVAGHEVDFLFDGSCVVVECDGWATHGLDREQFEFDRRRENRLVAAGFVVVRVTWRQVVSSPGEVAERIRAALRRWAPHLLEVAGPATGKRPSR